MNITPEILLSALNGLHATTTSSTYGEGVRLYALSLLEAWADRIRYNEHNNLPTEDLKPCLPYQLDNILLNGYPNWHKYAAACGHGVLADSYAVSCRLYGKEQADKLGDDYYYTDRPTHDEGRALKQAAMIIKNLAEAVAMLNA